MQQEVYDLMLKDELPRVGSGYRRVVVEIGRKWVKVRSKHMLPPIYWQHKIRLNKWNDLCAVPVTNSSIRNT